MSPGNSRGPSGRPNRRIPRPRGLTLIETLVTFVILGFLSTLILQAVGFFAARYEGVQRVHRVAALESLQQNWFATSVQGLVPYGVTARRFQGYPTYFEGITLGPLHAEAGTPVTVRWSIVADAVRYLETLGPPLPGVEWIIRPSDIQADSQGRGLRPSDSFVRTPQADRRDFGRTPHADSRDFGRQSNIETTSRPPAPSDAPQDLAFHYADAYANWYDHWPPLLDSKPLAEGDREAPSTKPPSVDDVVAALANPAAAAASNDPLAHPSRDWTPRLIRLVSAEQGTVWLARVEPSARPRVTDEAFR